MDDAELDSLSGTAVPDEAAAVENTQIAAELAAPEVTEAPAAEAAPVTAEATPETPAVEQRAEPRPEPTKQTVPLAVLMEERNERKALKQRLEEAERRIANAEKLEEEIRKLKEPQKPKVSFEEAPLEVIRDELGNMRKTVEEDRAARTKAEEESKARTSQQEGMRKFVDALRGDEAVFVEKNQDYYDALKFSREKNAQILSVYGYDETQIKQMVDQSELAQATAAMQRGLSPAQVAYEIARNMGYTPKQAAAIAAPAKDPSAEIADIKKKQAAAGLPSNTPPKVEDLADLTDSEFDNIFAEIFPKKAG